MHENLKKMGKNINWLEKEMKKFKLTPKEALIVTIDGKGKFFYQEKQLKNK